MKKPKRIFKKSKKVFNTNPFLASAVVYIMASHVQVEIIKSQPNLTKVEKGILIVETIKSLAESTKRATKSAMLFRFRTTGRYVR